MTSTSSAPSGSAAYSRRKFLSGTAAVAGAGALGLATSCSSGSGTKNGVVELQLFTGLGAQDAKLVKQVLAKFHKSHPKISVKVLDIQDIYTKLKTSAIGHKLPDVFGMQTFETASFASKGWMIPLDDYVRKDPDVKPDDLWPAEVTQMSYERKLYGLPYDFSTEAVYYNKTMFEEEGVPVPTGDWTWNQFFDIASHFTQKKGSRQVRWGCNLWLGDWVTMGFLRSNGGDTFSQDLKRCVIDSPVNVDTYEFFLQQMLKGNMPLPGATPQGVNPFTGGLVAMNIDGSWATETNRDGIKGKFEWDVVKLPTGNTGQRAASTAGACWSISRDSKHRDEAWQVVKFLSSERQENTLISDTTRSIPGRQSAAQEWLKVASTNNQPPAHVDIFLDQMKNDAVNWTYPPFWDEFELSYTNHIGAIGKKWKAKEALAKVQEETNKAAARYT